MQTTKGNLNGYEDASTLRSRLPSQHPVSKRLNEDTMRVRTERFQEDLRQSVLSQVLREQTNLASIIGAYVLSFCKNMDFQKLI